MKRRRGSARHQRAVERHRGQHDDEGGGEEPLQVLHAAGDAHLVAQRPQDVIAREQAEEVRERPEQRAHLLGPHRDDPREPAIHSGTLRAPCASLPRSAPCRRPTSRGRTPSMRRASPRGTGSKPASATSCMPILSAVGVVGGDRHRHARRRTVRLARHRLVAPGIEAAHEASRRAAARPSRPRRPSPSPARRARRRARAPGCSDRSPPCPCSCSPTCFANRRQRAIRHGDQHRVAERRPLPRTLPRARLATPSASAARFACRHRGRRTSPRARPSPTTRRASSRCGPSR